MLELGRLLPLAIGLRGGIPRRRTLAPIVVLPHEDGSADHGPILS
jgi:hypothetical protein